MLAWGSRDGPATLRFQHQSDLRWHFPYRCSSHRHCRLSGGIVAALSGEIRTLVTYASYLLQGVSFWRLHYTPSTSDERSCRPALRARETTVFAAHCGVRHRTTVPSRDVDGGCHKSDMTLVVAFHGMGFLHPPQLESILIFPAEPLHGGHQVCSQRFGRLNTIPLG